MHGERQQVRIGNLVVTHHARPVEHFFIAQAEVAWPELMIDIGAGQRQFLAHQLKARRRSLCITGQIQYPQYAILSDGTGGDFQFWLTKQFACVRVMDVGIVKQRHPHIGVQ